ncbi:villin-5 isoform X1 [Dendrobium catenatum]|uniref:villin-5 isoform X1 n=1 Tax=Dendrobium catenatum TaxID=906689 RepID=UPI0009F6DEE3|nr:villin-5 isoform X1 [Dendrobium catenatum]
MSPFVCKNRVKLKLTTRAPREERADAISIAYKMALSCKSRAVQVHIFEGREPLQFCAIFQRFIVLKGGYSSGYKKFISEGNIVDDSYKEDGTALFRVQGLGPDIMQAIQVDAVASSLNSLYCFILQACNALYTWAGNLTTSEDHELLERQLDLIKPNLQYKPLKEGAETEQFWDLLGGKREHPNEKIAKQPASDPHLFFCSYSQGTLKVNEVFNFSQDDLMTEDIYILDCQSDIFVWVGQQVDSKSKLEALNIGKKFLERDFLMEKLSRKTPIFIVTEGSEPQYFTRFFSWDSSKSAVHGNSYQRKLAIVKHGVTPVITKSKRLLPTYSGRSILTDKSPRSRSVSSTADRHRPRGRSPAFNAIASTFENLNSRNFSTPPVVGKIYPKSSLSDTKTAPRSAAIAALTSSFESAAQSSGQPLSRVRLPVRTTKAESTDNGSALSGRIGNLTISEDPKEEVNDEEDLPTYPYECLITSSTDPVTDIDVTKREAYLSSIEFKAKFNMSKSAFYKLPKWKQNKLKTALKLF